MCRCDEHDASPADGGQVFARLAGDGEVPPWEPLAGVAPALGGYIEYGIANLLGRPSLDLRTRELATVCMLAALGGLEPQLAFHAAGAVRCGATPAEVVEAVSQVSLYAGIPRTLNALAVVRQALNIVPAHAG
jgi:4-carboxymuconolactone decarboxylase